MGGRRVTWSAEETAAALAMDEDEFLAAHPHRNHNALRQRIEGVLGTGETYTQFRLRQAQERHEAAVAARRAPGMPEELPEDPEALERLFSAYLNVVEAADEVAGRPTKSLNWSPPGNLPVGVAFVSDIHAGAVIDYPRFEQVMRTIAETDGLYTIINGDLMENTKVQSKSGTALYGSLMPAPGLQLAYVTTRLRWARGKILAIAEGNHDAFDGRWAGIDRLPALAQDVGAEYFTEAGGSVFATVGGVTYHIVVKHNFRGISQITKGNSARRLWQEWEWAWENADVVALAHTHEPHAEQVMRKGELVTYLRSGTFKIRDEWAEDNGWRSAFGVPVVILHPGTKKVLPFHGQHFDDAVAALRRLREEEAA